MLSLFVRYAEVLIDVFAHTDNAVNLEPLHLLVALLYRIVCD